MLISCGHCKSKHNSTDGVRACSQGKEVWACTWLVDRGLTEDGDPIIIDCGCDSWDTNRGYECTAGHYHVHDEVRISEGWDYASDALEATMLRRNGIDAVSMRGDSI